MHDEHAWTQKVRFFGNAATLYLLTIVCAWYAVQPLHPFDHTRNVALTKTAQTPHLPAAPKIKLISGRPVRIVIPSESVDLPLDPGYYDSATDSWTLSGYRAQFAMMSTLANNQGGETFIYGHNNDYVFGALRHVTPSVGAEALLYASNGHIFAYKFVSVKSLAPSDVSILNYQGPPILTIQTCTGSLNEWRTMYQFTFDKVVQ